MTLPSTRGRIAGAAAPLAAPSPNWAAPLLVLVALTMTVILLWGWTRPLSVLIHQENPRAGAQMVVFYGISRAGALRWAVPAVLLLVLYLGAIWLAGRAHGRPATATALAAPVLFCAALLPAFPGGTQDIFHNIADARLFWLYGENPTRVPPNAHPEDPFLPTVFGYEGLTSAYGPLWYMLAGAPLPFTGDGVVANAVGQKALSSVFFLATVALLWLAALGRAGEHPPQERERRGLRAAVLAGWCPLLLWEFGVNAHNDALMICFVAAALFAASRRWWLWVVPLLALSVLIKFTSVLLGPVLLIWLLRRRDVPLRTVAAGIGIAALICVAAYIPFWEGWNTFTVLDRPGMTFINSPSALLQQAMVHRWKIAPDVAEPLVYRLTAWAFLFVALVALWQLTVRRATLTTAGFDVVFAYLLFASWWFWQWYVSWLVPLVVLVGTGRRVWAFVVMSAGALLSYLLWWADAPDYSNGWFRNYGIMVTFVFAVPLVIWASGIARAWRAPGHGRAPTAAGTDLL